MKYMKYLNLILLPIIMFSQAQKKAVSMEDYDWLVKDCQGCVLAMNGDSINFEEQWMHLAVVGSVITTKEGVPVSLEYLESPFWAEISFYGKSHCIYVTSLRMLRQLEFDASGYIVEID